MITLTSRIDQAIAAMEKGEEVDWQKLADLQALDLVRAGEQLATEAAAEMDAQVSLLEALIHG